MDVEHLVQQRLRALVRHEDHVAITHPGVGPPMLDLPTRQIKLIPHAIQRSGFAEVVGGTLESRILHQHSPEDPGLLLGGIGRLAEERQELFTPQTVDALVPLDLLTQLLDHVHHGLGLRLDIVRSSQDLGCPLVAFPLHTRQLLAVDLV